MSLASCLQNIPMVSIWTDSWQEIVFLSNYFVVLINSWLLCCFFFSNQIILNWFVSDLIDNHIVHHHLSRSTSAVGFCVHSDDYLNDQQVTPSKCHLELTSLNSLHSFFICILQRFVVVLNFDLKKLNSKIAPIL